MNANIKLVCVFIIGLAIGILSTFWNQSFNPTPESASREGNLLIVNYPTYIKFIPNWRKRLVLVISNWDDFCK